jgi:hypothetical protein
MSLNYNLTGTAFSKGEGRIPDRPEWPVVSTIIMLTPVIGIGTFTEKNIDEVIARFRFLEALQGCFITSAGKDMPVPESIIRDLVGLKTNVTTETRGRFQKRVADVFFRDGLKK